MGRLADYLGSRGGYGAALGLQQRVLAARERSSGAEHPDTLTARASLAIWTWAAGDAAAAVTKTPRCCPEHPDTLKARANLTFWTRLARKRR